jgi:hypothetical protein
MLGKASNDQPALASSRPGFFTGGSCHSTRHTCISRPGGIDRRKVVFRDASMRRSSYRCAAI